MGVSDSWGYAGSTTFQSICHFPTGELWEAFLMTVPMTFCRRQHWADLVLSPLYILGRLSISVQLCILKL